MDVNRRAQEAAAFLDAVRTASDAAELVLVSDFPEDKAEESLRRGHAMLLVAERNLNFCRNDVWRLLIKVLETKAPEITPLARLGGGTH